MFTATKEIPEFLCLLTNRAAFHLPEADANGQRPRHSCEPVQTGVSYAGIFT